jgi:hypothetical protein
LYARYILSKKVRKEWDERLKIWAGIIFLVENYIKK